MWCIFCLLFLMLLFLRALRICVVVVRLSRSVMEVCRGSWTYIYTWWWKWDCDISNSWTAAVICELEHARACSENVCLLWGYFRNSKGSNGQMKQSRCYSKLYIWGMLPLNEEPILQNTWIDLQVFLCYMPWKVSPLFAINENNYHWSRIRTRIWSNIKPFSRQLNSLLLLFPLFEGSFVTLEESKYVWYVHWQEAAPGSQSRFSRRQFTILEKHTCAPCAVFFRGSQPPCYTAAAYLAKIG